MHHLLHDDMYIKGIKGTTDSEITFEKIFCSYEKVNCIPCVIISIGKDFWIKQRLVPVSGSSMTMNHHSEVLASSRNNTDSNVVNGMDSQAANWFI
jgi:hypothetical protein